MQGIRDLSPTTVAGLSPMASPVAGCAHPLPIAAAVRIMAAILKHKEVMAEVFTVSPPKPVKW